MISDVSRETSLSKIIQIMVALASSGCEAIRIYDLYQFQMQVRILLRQHIMSTTILEHQHGSCVSRETSSRECPISDAFTTVGTFKSTYPLNTQMQLFHVEHS
ncbi:hypothetical protein DSM100238_0983 [Bifidobacterium apri]|uniref:Uncharacterized protein n=1 Tax=Bifidobacterium apri TaxID=1769423 RepID=A0A6A2WDY3_9BIFI|nr:hypothetical protein DSM100238_0983 [Bifidobacterium apri]